AGNVSPRDPLINLDADDQYLTDGRHQQAVSLRRLHPVPEGLPTRTAVAGSRATQGCRAAQGLPTRCRASAGKAAEWHPLRSWGSSDRDDRGRHSRTTPWVRGRYLATYRQHIRPRRTPTPQSASTAFVCHAVTS